MYVISKEGFNVRKVYLKDYYGMFVPSFKKALVFTSFIKARKMARKFEGSTIEKIK